MSHIDLWFELTLNQRRKLYSLGYNHVNIHEIAMSDFLKITKNKDHIRTLVEIKRSWLRLVG